MVKLMGYYQLPGSMPVQVSFEDLPEENMDAHVVKILDSAVGRKCWM